MTADVIHVRWRAPSAVQAEAEPRLVRLLDEGETLEWRRKAIAADKKLYLVAHALRRELIAELTGCAPDSLRFTRDAHGKPLLIHPVLGEDLFFSLSHTDGLAIVAASTAGPVGIDAERRSRHIGEAALKSVMSDAELRRISQSGPEQGIRFWTMKEAYSKALGLGMHLRFSDLDFSAGLSGIGNPPLGFHGWRGEELPVGDDHIATLAFPVRRGRPVRIDLRAPSHAQTTQQRYKSGI